MIFFCSAFEPSLRLEAMKDSKDSFGMQIHGQYTKGDKWSHLNSRNEKGIQLRVFFLASIYNRPKCLFTIGS